MKRPEGYNLQYLTCLTNIPNADTVIERIDIAARTATSIMRAMGMTLPDAQRVPTLDEVDRHLRLLVSEAIDGYLQSVRSLKENESDLEVDGVAEDDYFDVWVAPVVPGEHSPLHVRISMWLVQ